MTKPTPDRPVTEREPAIRLVIPPTTILASTDHEYRRDWQDEARNDRRIT